MDFKNMTTEELMERRAAIATECEAEDADTEALLEEVKAINAELDTRKAEAARREELRKAVAEGAGAVIETEERTEEKMDIEVRNTPEYISEYVEYLKDGNIEGRTLLSENAASDGTVAVPEYVYDIVKTAWEKNDIMNLVRRIRLAGNLKVNFEVSAGEATVHLENAGNVTEEELELGIITIIPQYIKKWIGISKQAYSLRGEAFLDYVYDELAQKIVKKAADTLIGLIAALPSTATSTSVCAQTVKTAPTLSAIPTAYANLSDEAANPVVVMNKATWADFEAARAAGQYAYDPYMNLPVRFSSALPAYSTASENDVYAIVGDFAEGALANFPNGDEVEFTFDPFTQKKNNIIEVLGEMYVGVAPIACNAFALLSKPASA